MIRKYILFFICFGALQSFGQEVLSGIEENHIIVKALNSQHNISSIKTTTSLKLPFRDDFSGLGPFPSDSLWQDRYVFINNAYPAFPPSTGVATFDALNDSGRIYYNASSLSFIADYLTSRPIRLDTSYTGAPAAIKTADSLYFSFFYQPQGIGDSPDAEDSLVLEFYSSHDSTWRHIWADDGISLQNFRNLHNSYFKHIMIPITDSLLYFKRDFKFRFYNYASIGNNNLPGWSGNVDQWHIDYVFLNIGRSLADTLYRDITFVAPAQSMLKKYQAMPWQQYNVSTNANMTDSINIIISNLSDITYNYQYLYNVKDPLGATIHNYDGGSFNLPPFYLNGYQNYTPHTKPPVGFSFPALTDKTDFTVKHILNPSAPADIIKNNDTSVFIQKFQNYYAYDDGTPEAGYGLSVGGGKAALKFSLNKSDTLRGIDVFFNRTFDNANWQYFNLMVWSSLNPETVIYQSALTKPVFPDSLNSFHTYHIEDAIIVSGDFYIGFKQTNGNNLNVGYDKNTRGDGFLYYNTDGNWYNTLYQGSLMMRPILGERIYYAGINNIAQNDKRLIVFPNPVNDGFFEIGAKDKTAFEEDAQIIIYSMTGSIVYSSGFMNKIDVSYLKQGIYMVVVQSKSSIHSTKLIISK